MAEAAAASAAREPHPPAPGDAASTMADPPPPLPALSAADFWVGPLLGEGAFGAVRSCRLKASGRAAAVKVVPKVTLAKHPAVLGALRRERRLLRQELRGLRGVVALWGAFHDDAGVYLVMELVEGGSLRDLLARRRGVRLPRDAALQYGMGILAALREVHARRVLHGDVTPGNVLLTARGPVKLCDFGSAVLLLPDANADPRRVLDGGGDADDDNEDALVIPRGTAGYASPEVLRGAPARRLTYGADVWSLGCVLHELCFGAAPFGSAAIDAVAAVDRTLAYAHLADPADRAARLFGAARAAMGDDDDEETALRDLILSLLEPDAARRTLGLPSDDWHTRMARDPAWGGGGVRDGADDGADAAPPPPGILPDAAAAPRGGLSSVEPEFVDGAAGWSAFLL